VNATELKLFCTLSVHRCAVAKVM